MRFCVDPPRVSAVGGSQTGGLTLKTSENPDFAKSSQTPLVWDNSPAMSVGSVSGSQRTNAIYHLFLVQTRWGMHKYLPMNMCVCVRVCVCKGVCDGQ